MDKKPRYKPQVVRVFKVSNPDLVNRMLRYHKYQMSKMEPGYALKHKARPPNPEKPLFEVPVQVTLCEGTRRGWEEAERLLGVVNKTFACARVQLDFADEHQCTNVPAYALDCPFSEDLDHSYEWLHVVLVRSLPGDEPVALPCGRCLLISDRCDDRSWVRALAMLLGLWKVSESDRLMGEGNGYQLVAAEQAWLRWHAANMGGEAWPLNGLSLPLWVYKVETPQRFGSQRSEQEIRDILQRVNRIWESVGIQFQINLCHLHEDEVSARTWESVLARPLPEGIGGVAQVLTHAPYALHLFLVGGAPAAEPVELEPRWRACWLTDSLQTNRSRTLAWTLGRLIGMSETGGADQLMTRDGSGYRLGAQELMRARGLVSALNMAG